MTRPAIPVLGAIPLLGALLLLAGCYGDTGVLPAGPGVFTASAMRAPVLGGGAAAQETVLAEAAAFCRSRGGGVQLLDLRPDGDPRTRYWPTAFDAAFRCVPTAPQ